MSGDSDLEDEAPRGKSKKGAKASATSQRQTAGGKSPKNRAFTPTFASDDDFGEETGDQSEKGSKSAAEKAASKSPKPTAEVSTRNPVSASGGGSGGGAKSPTGFVGKKKDAAKTFTQVSARLDVEGTNSQPTGPLPIKANPPKAVLALASASGSGSGGGSGGAIPNAKPATGASASATIASSLPSPQASASSSSSAAAKANVAVAVSGAASARRGAVVSRPYAIAYAKATKTEVPTVLPTLDVLQNSPIPKVPGDARPWPIGKPPQVDFVIHVVNNRELWAAHQFIKVSYPLENPIGVAMYIGSLKHRSEVSILLVKQPEAGSAGPLKSQQIFDKLFMLRISCRAVVGIGVAMGWNPVKQRIFDVLTCNSILQYESTREGDGKVQLRAHPLFSQASVSAIMQSRAYDWQFDLDAPALKDCVNLTAAAKAEWITAAAHQKDSQEEVRLTPGLSTSHGAILSGNKLMAGYAPRDESADLWKKDENDNVFGGQELVGAEMEGFGFYSASGNVACMVIKAVTDYGFNKNTQTKKEKELQQRRGAYIAFSHFVAAIPQWKGLVVQVPAKFEPQLPKLPTTETDVSAECAVGTQPFTLIENVIGARRALMTAKEQAAAQTEATRNKPAVQAMLQELKEKAETAEKKLTAAQAVSDAAKAEYEQAKEETAVRVDAALQLAYDQAYALLLAEWSKTTTQLPSSNLKVTFDDDSITGLILSEKKQRPRMCPWPTLETELDPETYRKLYSDNAQRNRKFEISFDDAVAGCMRDSSSGSGSPGGATEGGDEDENERITDDNNKQHGKRAGSTLARAGSSKKRKANTKK